MYLKPTEIKVSFHRNGGWHFYTVEIVYSANSSAYMGRKFMTRRDVNDYCDREWHGVPVTFVEIE